MALQQSPRSKSGIEAGRPPFERIALLLQGGGALGAYQAGVYQALAEHKLHPDWVAGISIGAINSALIAGNPQEKRVEALRGFWEAVTEPPLGLAVPADGLLGLLQPRGDFVHGMVNQMRAFATMVSGAPNFFSPRPISPLLSPPGSIEATSFYDVGPLKTTLENLVDFDRINAAPMRFSVGAVNVRTGNFTYFDTTTDVIRPEHVMASGALPPSFPAVEIEGEHYWDGGLVSNTPLDWVLSSTPRKDTLAFQVDLWSARGEFPRDITGLDLRQKDIRFSSRTRASTDKFRKLQKMRRALHHLLKMVPKDVLDNASDETKQLINEADEKAYNIIQLIYRAKSYEGSSKDYEFSRSTMEDHWTSGYNDAVRTLRYPQVLQRSPSSDGVTTFDLAEDGK
jgi:NTE family protein